MRGTVRSAASEAHEEAKRTSPSRAGHPSSAAGPVCFVFLDGVGLAPPGATNPLTRATPGLRLLLDGPLLVDRVVDEDQLLFLPLDACLGLPGLPQSATGQTALFTGLNAAERVGGHVPAYPPKALQQIIAQRSMLKRAADAGLHVTFANAYSDHYWERAERRLVRHSASTLTAMASGARFRSMEDLHRGEAVYWDITHAVLRAHYDSDIPLLDAAVAGEHLAGLMRWHDLVLFETFLPDLAGHGRLPWPSEQVMSTVDSFLQGLLESLPSGSTLIMSSDHGNVEDASCPTHTRNPVPLLAIGPGADAFRQARSITDVTPALLRWLGVKADED